METFKNISKFILIPASLMGLIEMGRLASIGQHDISHLAISIFIATIIMSSTIWSSITKTKTAIQINGGHGWI